MPPAPKSADPLEWLRHAQSNLLRARDRRLPGVLLEHQCFDAQQAAEKAVKAVLVHRQIRFPRTHDIAVLLSIVQQEGMDVPDSLRKADRLSAFAIEHRYPADSGPVSEQDYLEALDLAERVYAWAESLIRDAAL